MNQNSHFAVLRGKLTWKLGETFYELIRAPKNKITDEAIVLIHGGPGSSHLFYRPFCESLVSTLPVLVYDQIGSGFSSKVTHPAKLVVADFVEELSLLRKKLGLKKLHLFSHSWGAVIATEYTVKYSRYVASNIFFSPFFDTRDWIQDANKLLKTIPIIHQKAVARSLKSNDFGTKEFGKATDFYNKWYLRRKEIEFPERTAGNALFGLDIYKALWGASEFVCTGKLKNYSAVSKLKKITQPALFICGQFDEAIPSTVKKYSSLVVQGKFRTIKGVAHCAHYENPKELKTQIIRHLKSLAFKVY
jgi:proline iminopeptidase